MLMAGDPFVAGEIAFPTGENSTGVAEVTRLREARLREALRVMIGEHVIHTPRRDDCPICLAMLDEYADLRGDT
jgi:hypothetical protein